MHELSPMRVKVELFVDLDAVAADAGDSLSPDAQPRLYDTLDWYRLTHEHILPDKPLVIARARSEAGTAWLFLAETVSRRAEPLGSWYTLRFGPVFAGKADAPHADERSQLLRAIAGALKSRLARLSLQPINDADLAALHKAFAGAGWLTDASVQTVNWVAHVGADDFAGYWAKRPGQLRSTVKRKAGKAKLSIRILDGFDPDAWADYEAVFAASWKGEEGSPAFLRSVAEMAASWGRLRMGIAHDAAGTPLAAQFWTIDGPADARVATIHKLAYADAAKALSPGSILSHEMFEHVIARDAPREIDFGTGDDPYKADWMDEKRALHRFDAYNPRTRSGAAGYLRARAAALVARLRNT